MAAISTNRPRTGNSDNSGSDALHPPRSRPQLALVPDSSGGSLPGQPIWLAGCERPQLSRHVRRRVGDLIDCVSQGRVFEAIDEFYAQDVLLSQGAMAPMFCLDPKLARGHAARQDLVWERFSADGVGVNFDTSFIECELEFSALDGQRFTSRYVAIAQWRDGKIARESLPPTRAAYHSPVFSIEAQGSLGGSDSPS